LVVSSTFPYKQYGKDRIPFFPNPLPFPDERIEGKDEALINAELRKKYKKAFSYVNLDDFSGILKGSLTAKDLRKRLRDIYDEEERRTGKPKDERRITPQEIEQTAPRLEDFSMTHNTINRLRGGTLDLPVDGGAPGETAGQLFHSPEYYWTDKYADPNQDANTGIFFLAAGPDTGKLEAVLRLFRHWGFGADRTSGKGFFDADMQNFTLPYPTDANAMLNLSLFRPTGEELTALDSHDAADKRFHYRIELREGWVGADGFYLPKKPHRYFTEGSVFPLLPLPEYRHLGALVHQFDKPHPVYDNGFGFMIPLKWPV
jgi:CRISPR type III-A-associated RAMP protein Csm4